MITIEIVSQLTTQVDEVGELIKRAYDITVAGPMPDLSNKKLEHIIEIEKIKYLIGLTELPKFHILAKDGVKIIGFGIISESSLQFFYDLTWVCVDPAYRKQGIGKQITVEATKFAKSRDRNIIITTEVPKFYTELGFTIAGN